MRVIKEMLSDIESKTFDLGFVGEKNHTCVMINCVSLFNQYPDAVATMVARSPVDDIYPVVLHRDGVFVVWNISESDIANAGSGQYQLTFTDGEGDNAEIIKTVYGSFSVKPSMVSEGEPPEPIEDWLEEANEALAEFGKINELSASATTLPAGQQATAEITNVNGHKNIAIGIPKGDKGDKGDDGDPAPAEEVTAAVDAYLAENFSNPSNPPLDRSLSSSSSAAPADLVGDLKSAFESTLSPTSNLLNDTKRYKYNNDNMYLGADNGDNLFGTYLAQGTYTLTVWFDSDSITANSLTIANGSENVKVAYTTNTTTFTVSTAGYHSVRVYGDYGNATHITHAQIETGSISSEYVVPFAPNDIIARAEINKKISNIINITPDRNGYRTVDGLFIRTTGYKCSCYIGVKGGKIRAIHNVYKNGTTVIPWCVFITKTGVIYYVNDTPDTIPSENIDQNGVLSEIDIPSNAVAVSVVTPSSATENSFQLIYDTIEERVESVCEDIIFNNNSSMLIEQGILENSTGAYYLSDYVQVKAGDIVEVYVRPYITTNYNNYRTALAVMYDKDFFPVNVIKLPDSITSVSDYISKYHIVSQNEKYVRVSSLNNDYLWASVSRIAGNETDNENMEKNVIIIPASILTINRYFTSTGKEPTGMLSSPFIRMEAGDKVSCRSYGIVGTNNLSCIVSFFDENKAFISGIYNTGESSSMINIQDAVAPSGTKYVMFTKHATSYSFSAMLVRMMREETSEITPPPRNTISLAYPNQYKSISLIGDSITQGEGVTYNVNDSYAGILRKMFSVEYGEKLNYGFCSFSTLTNDMVRFATQSGGFTRDYGDSSVLGGDSYTSSTVGATLEFVVSKQFPYMKIASVFGGSGVFTVSNDGTTLATIDLSEGNGIGYSDLFSIENADITKNFVITVVSGTVKVSGVQLIENQEWITFNNYGRSGASPSVFVGDLFAKESEADIVFYALGANSSAEVLIESVDSIKAQFKANTARKVVLDVVNMINTNYGKHSILRKFASEVGADYVGIMEDLLSLVPSIPNDFFADGTHPSAYGHRFIAETAAKAVGLAITSKNTVEMMLE